MRLKTLLTAHTGYLHQTSAKAASRTKSDQLSETFAASCTSCHVSQIQIQFVFSFMNYTPRGPYNAEPVHASTCIEHMHLNRRG